MNNPPHPLTEEDIWFQIGHVHEQQKDVSLPNDPMLKPSLTTNSMIPRRPLTCGSLSDNPTTQRYYNSLGGSIISRVAVLIAKNKQFNTWRSPLKQVSLIPRKLPCRICGSDVLIRRQRCAKLVFARSTPRRTKRISKRCTVTAGTQRSGVRLVCSTIKLTSIAMLSTHIPVPSA